MKSKYYVQTIFTSMLIHKFTKTITWFSQYDCNSILDSHKPLLGQKTIEKERRITRNKLQRLATHLVEVKNKTSVPPIHRLHNDTLKIIGDTESRHKLIRFGGEFENIDD